MPEKKKTEMLNGGTELEAINNAINKNRTAAEQAKVQKNISAKPRCTQQLVASVCLGVAALAGIVGLCQMGAMVEWLGAAEACAVCLRLGIEIGRKGVK